MATHLPFAVRLIAPRLGTQRVSHPMSPWADAKIRKGGTGACSARHRSHGNRRGDDEWVCVHRGHQESAPCFQTRRQKQPARAVSQAISKGTSVADDSSPSRSVEKEKQSFDVNENRRPLAGKVFGLCELVGPEPDIASKRYGYSRVLATASHHKDLSVARLSLAGRGRENGIRARTRTAHAPSGGQFHRQGSVQPSQQHALWRRRRRRRRRLRRRRWQQRNTETAGEAREDIRRQGVRVTARPCSSQAFESYERFLRQHQQQEGRPHRSQRLYENPGVHHRPSTGEFGSGAAKYVRGQRPTSSPTSSMFPCTVDFVGEHGNSRNLGPLPPLRSLDMRDTFPAEADEENEGAMPRAGGLMRRLCQFYAESRVEAAEV